MKKLVGILVALTGLLFLWVVFRPEPEATAIAGPAGSRTFTSSAECRECHAEIYADWERSQHAMSWVNPAVRELSNDFANQDCIDCHAPRPIFVTGVNERVLPRTSRRVEGVDCIACHQRPDGRMAGTRTNDKVACRPIETPDLGKPEFCVGCHNQHQTVDQWRASSWFANSQDCLDCHMPWPNGDPNLPRDHFFPGGNVLAMVQRAVELRGAREGDHWALEIANVGAGHAFPTDERSRAADVFWRPLAQGGATPGPWRHLHRMRAPYRTETDLPTTLLEADETRALALPDDLPEAKGPIEVALFYKRKPYWQDPEHPDPDNEAQLVQKIELVP